MPEGTFEGHDGFRQWYRDAHAHFKPASEHIIEQVSTRKTADDQLSAYRTAASARQLPLALHNHTVRY